MAHRELATTLYYYGNDLAYLMAGSCLALAGTPRFSLDAAVWRTAEPGRGGSCSAEGWAGARLRGVADRAEGRVPPAAGRDLPAAGGTRPVFVLRIQARL